MKKIIFILTIIIALFSCKKNILENNTTAFLHFSNDTILFDTSFNSIGTPTKILTIYNKNNFNVTTNILLNAINNGAFRMNIDGESSNIQNTIEIPSNDSIFIFLEATASENTSNNFLLTNNIEFTTGTNKQEVQLVLPGRNANFHLPHDNLFFDGLDSVNFKYFSIKGNKVWTNNLPHVIYGYVVIEPEATLTIEEGTEIYFHNNSGILVGNPILINNDGIPPNNNGTLIINGTLNNEVILRGDRLDYWYEDLPGQWNGIHFVQGSVNSTIKYAIISNGVNAIRADSVSNNNPTIEIENTIIKNMSGIGILGQGAYINAKNTVISECGQYSVACYIGGNYNFTHCTFANYWNFNRRTTPSILLNNYYEASDGNIYIRDLESANFINCIIDGPLSTEISLQKQDLGLFNYTFDHCILKIDPTFNTESTNYINSILNVDVEFIDVNENDFHLTEQSPAINSGKSTINFNDLDGFSRVNPDIGAYEFVD